MPSITFYINIDLETLRQRKKKSSIAVDRLESQEDDFYERIHKGYLKLAELNKSRIKIIDGTNSIEKIKNQIWKLVSREFEL